MLWSTKVPLEIISQDLKLNLFYKIFYKRTGRIFNAQWTG